MPKNSTDTTEAINRSFEPDDVPQPEDGSAESTAWLNDRMNEWFNE